MIKEIDKDEPRHGDIMSIGISRSGCLQIEYWDVSIPGHQTSFLLFDKEDCETIKGVLDILEKRK